MGISDFLGDPLGGFTTQYGDGTSTPAQAQPQPATQVAPQAAPQAPTYQPPHGIKALLGMVGDALLVAHGLPPMYQQRVQQQRENAALSGFLTNPDQAIQQLMQIDPKSGIQLYSQVHPKSEIPEGVREYNYYNGLPTPQKSSFEKFLQLTHPSLVAPIPLGENEHAEPVTSAASLPHVTDQKSYDAVPAGAQYVTPDNKIRTKGGPAPQASATFPVR